MEKQANLSDATLLYVTLGKYIPSLPTDENNYLEFIGKIIDSIQKNEDYTAYLDAIQIMTGITFNVLSTSSSEEILDLFISGLMEWRIVELVEFFRDIGYKNA